MDRVFKPLPPSGTFGGYDIVARVVRYLPLDLPCLIGWRIKHDSLIDNCPYLSRFREDMSGLELENKYAQKTNYFP